MRKLQYVHEFLSLLSGECESWLFILVHVAKDKIVDVRLGDLHRLWVFFEFFAVERLGLRVTGLLPKIVVFVVFIYKHRVCCKRLFTLLSRYLSTLNFSWVVSVAFLCFLCVTSRISWDSPLVFPFLLRRCLWFVPLSRLTIFFALNDTWFFLFSDKVLRVSVLWVLGDLILISHSM